MKRMKKYLSILLALALCLGVLTLPGMAVSFSDVPQGAWYEESVAYGAERGFVKGMNETVFAPDAVMTRAQFVVMLGRALNLTSTNYLNPFTDINEGKFRGGLVAPVTFLSENWYDEYVVWAHGTGIVAGTSPTTFSPGEPITREQAVTMLDRFLEAFGYVLPELQEEAAFADAGEIHGYALPHVASLSRKGIVFGDEQGRFCPRAQLTRAQGVALLARIFKKLDAQAEEEGEVAFLGEIPYVYDPTDGGPESPVPLLGEQNWRIVSSAEEYAAIVGTEDPRLELIPLPKVEEGLFADRNLLIVERYESMCPLLMGKVAYRGLADGKAVIHLYVNSTGGITAGDQGLLFLFSVPKDVTGAEIEARQLGFCWNDPPAPQTAPNPGVDVD